MPCSRPAGTVERPWTSAGASSARIWLSSFSEISIRFWVSVAAPSALFGGGLLKLDELVMRPLADLVALGGELGLGQVPVPVSSNGPEAEHGGERHDHGQEPERPKHRHAWPSKPGLPTLRLHPRQRSDPRRRLRAVRLQCRNSSARPALG